MPSQESPMYVLLALLLSLSPALAGELAGVTMADTTTVAGQSLVLNGMGLREKFFIDVYVGGLYLPAKTTDGDKAVQDDVPKQIRMEFIYSSVPAKKMIDTYREGFDVNPAAASLTSESELFLSWVGDMTKGDLMILEYVPGTGTTLTMAGKVKGTIPGPEFMRLVFSNYVGPHASKQLRRGMLSQ